MGHFGTGMFSHERIKTYPLDSIALRHLRSTKKADVPAIGVLVAVTQDLCHVDITSCWGTPGTGRLLLLARACTAWFAYASGWKARCPGGVNAHV